MDINQRSFHEIYTADGTLVDDFLLLKDNFGIVLIDIANKQGKYLMKNASMLPTVYKTVEAEINELEELKLMFFWKNGGKTYFSVSFF